MSEPTFGARSPAGNSCQSCGKPVAMNMRRCPSCGDWIRPWSTGGKPSRWARFPVGGSGRPDEVGGATTHNQDVDASVWVRWGPNGEYVKQQTARGEDARSGAHQPIRGGRPPKQPKKK